MKMLILARHCWPLCRTRLATRSVGRTVRARIREPPRLCRASARCGRRDGAKSPQTVMALAEFRRDETVAALYGFSGGGYNVRHIITALGHPERARLELVVVLGAPKNPSHLYKGTLGIDLSNGSAGRPHGRPARIARDTALTRPSIARLRTTCWRADEGSHGRALWVTWRDRGTRRPRPGARTGGGAGPGPCRDGQQDRLRRTPSPDTHTAADRRQAIAKHPRHGFRRNSRSRWRGCQPVQAR
jgi:hypothetical protein